jgi:hypothetical protein
LAKSCGEHWYPPGFIPVTFSMGLAKGCGEHCHGTLAGKGWDWAVIWVGRPPIQVTLTDLQLSAQSHTSTGTIGR